MYKSIMPETREQLEALCRKVTVSRHLDEEIRRELFSHMEDRMLAHMNGELPMTEEDAFVLVREHFGDPAVIKEHLQGVYVEEAACSMGRRLAAAFIGFAAVGLFCAFLELAGAGASSVLGIWRAPVQMTSFWAVELILSPWLTYMLLRWWKRRLEHGERVWFQEVPRGRLLQTLGVAAVAMAALAVCSGWLGAFDQNALDQNAPDWFAAFPFVSVSITGAIWIWFCDQPPHTRRSVHFAAGLWALYLCAVSILATVPVKSHTAPNLAAFMVLLCGCFASSVVFGVLGLGTYRVAQWARRRSGAPVQAG